MEKIRVLIVDDSPVISKFLASVLSGEEDFEVVGRAMSAEEALICIRDTRPDVLTLDLEIPGVKGLDLLVAIRAQAPNLPVIMFNSMTSSAAAILVDAFMLGAAGHVSKPANTGGMAASVIHLQQQLVPKIRQLGRRLMASAPVVVPPVRVAGTRHQDDVAVVVVGTSVGGGQALAALFSAMPAGFSLPIVVAANTSAELTPLLMERLAQICSLEFRVAQQGDVLRPAVVFMVPDNQSACFVREGEHVCIAQVAAVNEEGGGADLDRLLDSTAAVFSDTAVAVMLAGVGQDGVQGCTKIYACGGDILVQNEATAVVWETPGLIVSAGLAQQLLSPVDIAGELCRRASQTQGNHPQESPS